MVRGRATAVTVLESKTDFKSMTVALDADTVTITMKAADHYGAMAVYDIIERSNRVDLRIDFHKKHVDARYIYHVGEPVTVFPVRTIDDQLQEAWRLLAFVCIVWLIILLGGQHG